MKICSYKIIPFDECAGLNQDLNDFKSYADSTKKKARESYTYA
jgi:hypothetical protein